MRHHYLFRSLFAATLVVAVTACDSGPVTTQSGYANDSAAQAEAAGLSHGEYVARLGNCVACHSTPDGDALAGGLEMNVPMLGNIYATNITPDPEHGIGDWSFEEFDRSMRVGITKEGQRMYPAMPYTSYAKMSEQDMRALYDFLMNEVEPSKQPNPENAIPAWKNARWAMGIWNFMAHENEAFTPNPDESDDWNRGAYLVQGLGHCGACHTPRGLMMQEKALDESGKAFLAGAKLDHWYASSLNGDINSGLGRLSVEDVEEFLRTGKHRLGTAFGTMVEVINNSTTHMSEDDLRGMAVYLKSLPAQRDEGPAWQADPSAGEKLAQLDFDEPGAAIYYEYCSNCHVKDGSGYYPYQPALAGNPVLMDPDPASLINITLNGSLRVIAPNEGPDVNDMPYFRQLLTDQEVADVVSYIRTSWGNNADPVSLSQVQEIREATDPSSNDDILVLRMK